MKYLSAFALAVILVIGGCDSNGSDPQEGGDDGNGDGDFTGEVSFNIRIEAANSGAAAVEYSYECYDAEGDQTGATGSGTISASAGSFTTNMCAGFGTAVDATYADGTSPIVVQIVTGANDENVLAEETLQDEGDSVSFRLGTAPGS